MDWKTGISLDALASSHPISQPVDHPKQIKEIFDSITYNKVRLVLRLINRQMFSLSSLDLDQNTKRNQCHYFKKTLVSRETLNYFLVSINII